MQISISALFFFSENPVIYFLKIYVKRLEKDVKEWGLWAAGPEGLSLLWKSSALTSEDRGGWLQWCEASQKHPGPHFILTVISLQLLILLKVIIFKIYLYPKDVSRIGGRSFLLCVKQIWWNSVKFSWLQSLKCAYFSKKKGLVFKPSKIFMFLGCPLGIAGLMHCFREDCIHVGFLESPTKLT